MEYGCIGEHLTHSFSKEIHGYLQDCPYILQEIPMGALDAFLQARDFKAINVTIPYKQAVIPHLDWVDPIAKQIGAVNTIVNRGGKLHGYNTDFGGMADMIRWAQIPMAGKKVLIFGTGGTCRTAEAVARHMGAASVYRVSRSQTPNAITYETAQASHLDAQVLINTTPRGMFSREAGMPMDPGLFTALQGVVDAVYNPLRTEFVLKARDLGVPATGGLYMLVRQAVLASQIFWDTTYPASITQQLYRRIAAGKENIVLTGMPGCGKSTIGRALARELGRPFVDLDEAIAQRAGMQPGQIISTRGEAAFRDLESATIRALSDMTGAVIATGGGAVLRQENVDLLRRNGRLFFLDRPLSQLLPTPDRPLSATKEAICKRYTERYHIYRTTADAVIPNDTTPENSVQLLKKEFLG